MQLREIAPAVYARDVLPLTAPLWAGRRSLGQYISQTLELADTRYGRKHYRTIGLYDGTTLLASFKRYERTLADGLRGLRAIGLGAVFTPVDRRGRGYASFMLAAALDAARTGEADLAYLFSDIHPQFYAELGFRALPSRELALRADALPPGRLPVELLPAADCEGVRRCFALGERRRHAGFSRTPALWEWIALRMRHGSEHRAGSETNLAYRRRGVRAYVLGARVPERDAYVVDEFGYIDDEAPIVPALMRAAAGDLRRVVGWLPPGGARDALPKGMTRKRKRAILMAAPLSPQGAALLDRTAASADDFCWATDHI